MKCKVERLDRPSRSLQRRGQPLQQAADNKPRLWLPRLHNHKCSARALRKNGVRAAPRDPVAGMNPACGVNEDHLTRLGMGQPAADLLELFAAVGEAHMQRARDPVKIEDSDAQPCLGRKRGAKPGDRVDPTARMFRIIWPTVESQPMRVAQQQQADMKIGIGRANGGIVQEHGGIFEQGTIRNGVAATLRPGQAVRFRHCVTGNIA